jgi:hypothetical protein
MTLRIFGGKSLSIIVLVLHYFLHSPITSFAVVLHVTPPAEHCHNSKHTTFQERVKTTGRGDAIASKDQRHFSPLAAILENRRVTLFH